MKTFRIGIVGIGAIAEMHARAIADIDGAELVGGCCRTESKGLEFAKKFSCKFYPTCEELLEQEKPDVVTICTPSGAHLEPAAAAAKRGIHVLCEKPLEITIERARQMITAAGDGGIHLGGIFPQRFNPVVRAIYDAARAGRFGPLAVAVAYVPWWREDTYYSPDRWQGTVALDGGGALMNQSIHAIDAIQWIAAAAGAGKTSKVFGLTAQRGHATDLIEVEDTAVGLLQFENGALGNILGATSMWPGTSLRIHIAGRDGTAEVHEDQMVTWKFRNELPEDEQIRSQFSGAAAEGGAADPMAIDYANHTRNIANFLETVATDGPLLIDGAEACKALAIIRAVYESAGSGQPVSL